MNEIKDLKKSIEDNIRFNEDHKNAVVEYKKNVK